MTAATAQVPVPHEGPKARPRGRGTVDPYRVILFGLTNDQRVAVYTLVKVLRAMNAAKAGE